MGFLVDYINLLNCVFSALSENKIAPKLRFLNKFKKNITVFSSLWLMIFQIVQFCVWISCNNIIQNVQKEKKGKETNIEIRL